MSVYLQAVTDARQRRETAEHAFRAALQAAVPYHSWAEIARAAGLSRSGARYLALELNERRTRDDGHA